jgi:hypothetical protein
MWRCVALVRTDVSEEHITFVIRVQRISQLGIMLAATSNFISCSHIFITVAKCYFPEHLWGISPRKSWSCPVVTSHPAEGTLHVNWHKEVNVKVFSPYLELYSRYPVTAISASSVITVTRGCDVPGPMPMYMTHYEDHEQCNECQNTGSRRSSSATAVIAVAYACLRR